MMQVVFDNLKKISNEMAFNDKLTVKPNLQKD